MMLITCAFPLRISEFGHTGPEMNSLSSSGIGPPWPEISRLKPMINHF